MRNLGIALVVLLALCPLASAGTILGLGGVIAPVTAWNENPAVTILPRLAMGADSLQTLVLADFWFTVEREEGEWAQGFISDINLSYCFKLADWHNVTLGLGPMVVGSFGGDTQENGQFILALVPTWAIRGAVSWHFGLTWGVITLDFVPDKGIVPGVLMGVEF